MACITYNNECARELETRLYELGVEPGRRVFVGTVHSFSLTQIILPYAKTAKLGLPDEFAVADRHEQHAALESAFKKVVGGPENPQDWFFPMGRYRRSILNRDSREWRETDPQLAQLVEAYENELRRKGLIDFDDMPLLAIRGLRDAEWMQRAILAKYPVLAIDEYQDLGRALHRMAMGLCFSAGLRLFAVGDADQSIYGFTGAHPDLLQQLSERSDVQTVRLALNYRCGSRIISASEYALGERRGYRAPDNTTEGTIYFYSKGGNYENQADFVFSSIIPASLARTPGLKLSDIAILYPAAWIGDKIAAAAEREGYGAIRSDTNALYPRSNRILRWLEGCAVWCRGGWRTGKPRFSRLVQDAQNLFSEALTSPEKKRLFQRALLQKMWGYRNNNSDLHTWLTEMRSDLLTGLIALCSNCKDEAQVLEEFINRISPDGDAAGMTLDAFANLGDGSNRIALSTLHSSKGREFAVVILFAMDEGRIPRPNATVSEIREARRLFYVGFTRAKAEVHVVHTSNRASRFVVEVKNRLAEE